MEPRRSPRLQDKPRVQYYPESKHKAKTNTNSQQSIQTTTDPFLTPLQEYSERFPFKTLRAFNRYLYYMNAQYVGEYCQSKNISFSDVIMNYYSWFKDNLVETVDEAIHYYTNPDQYGQRFIQHYL